MPRAVAQLGSAPDWGSGGRRFKSCQPDRKALMRRKFHQGFIVSADGFLLVPLWSPWPIPSWRLGAEIGSKWAGLWIRGPKGDQNRSEHRFGLSQPSRRRPGAAVLALLPRR